MRVAEKGAQMLSTEYGSHVTYSERDLQALRDRLITPLDQEVWALAARQSKCLTFQPELCDGCNRRLVDACIALTNPEHGPDWTDWQQGDDGDSCKCGFNGTSQECARNRATTTDPKQRTA